MVLTDIADVVENARHILENEFRLRHIRLEKTLQDRDFPRVLMDVGQIEQVLVNLFLNALQAIETEGTVTVRTSMSHDGKKVCIGVSDTGCGVPQENMDKIFEPFFSTRAEGNRPRPGCNVWDSAKTRGKRLCFERPRTGQHVYCRASHPARGRTQTGVGRGL